MVQRRRSDILPLGPHAHPSGQGLVEYAIILGLLSALVLGALAMTGHSVSDVFSQVNRTIGGEPVEVEPTPTPPGETPVPTPTPTLDQPPTPGPTPTPTPSGSLWDDFDQPCDPPPAPCPPGWWKTMGQYWYLDDGWLCAGRTDGGNSGEHRAFTGQNDWTDYTIAVRAILHNTGAPNTTQGFGIYFRVTLDAQGNPTGYLFQYEPGQPVIVPPWPWVQGGTRAQPDYAPPMPPEPPEPGFYRGAFTYRKVVNGAVRAPFAQAIAPWDYKWFEVEREIKIVVQGNTFTTYVDGVQVLRASDSEFSAGQIGLRLWGRSNACFDHVGVTPQ